MYNNKLNEKLPNEELHPFDMENCRDDKEIVSLEEAFDNILQSNFEEYKNPVEKKVEKPVEKKVEKKIIEKNQLKKQSKPKYVRDEFDNLYNDKYDKYYNK
jgi:NH3-dependent NAD+ synthetase